MHPHYLRDIVDRRSNTPRIFVAMSFDPAFQHRFENVIATAIRQVSWKEVPLEPHRVDMNTISDSIMAEIVDGITNDLFVLVDITTIGSIGGRPVRNGNVMYELGLAHAIRRPEHVLVFRSDDDPLLFDVSGIRVRHYDPDGDPERAEEIILESIEDAGRLERRTRRSIIEGVAKSLDPLSLAILWRIAGYPSLSPRFADLKLLARDVQLQPNIQRLLELRLIETVLVRGMGPESGPAGLDELTDLHISYLGHQVAFYSLERTGVWEAFAHEMPEIKAQLDSWLAGKEEQW